MRRFAFFLSALALIGCARPETESAADTSAAATVATPAPVSLGDVAGRWSVRATNEVGDSILVTYELNATADAPGWTMTFPNRSPIPVRVVAVDADSIVTDAGPYESVLRPGVRVTVRSALRLQDGELVGTGVARYSAGPDTILNVRIRGTRTP